MSQISRYLTCRKFKIGKEMERKRDREGEEINQGQASRGGGVTSWTRKMKNCGQSAILVFLFKLNQRKRERTERLLRRLRCWKRRGWLYAEKMHQRKMKWNSQNSHCNNTPVDSSSIVWACRDGNISRSSYQRAVLLSKNDKETEAEMSPKSNKHSAKNKILEYVCLIRRKETFTNAECTSNTKSWWSQSL